MTDFYVKSNETIKVDCGTYNIEAVKNMYVLALCLSKIFYCIFKNLK